MKAKDLRNSILQMAVQGKLVPQAPNDEPASVLLERIRAERRKLIAEKKIKAPKGGESIIFRASDGLHYENTSSNSPSLRSVSPPPSLREDTTSTPSLRGGRFASDEAISSGTWFEQRFDAKGKPLGEPVCIDDEIPFDIPNTWQWARMSTLIDLLSGVDLTSAQYNDKHEGIPYLTGASNFKNRCLIENRWTNQPKRISKRGDLLFTCKGTVGAMTINTFEQAHIARQIMAVKPIDSLTLEYVELFLMSMVQSIKSQAKGVIPGIERNTILSALVPLPPVDEQERIVQKIQELLPFVDEYDNLEDARERLDAELPEKLRKSVLQLAVQGKLVPQDSDDEPASVLLERIRAERRKLIAEKKIKSPKGGESVIFRGSDGCHYEKRIDAKGHESEPVCIDDEIPFNIPNTWQWVRLGSLIHIESGKGLTTKEMKGGSIPVYGGNGIAGYHNESLVSQETVVIGRVGFYCGSVHVTEREAWVTDNAFLTVCPQDEINRSYLVAVLRHMNLGRDKNATAQPVVSGKKVYPLLFPLPPLLEQGRIAERLDELLPLLRDKSVL